MSDSAKDYMREAFLGLEDGGVHPDDLNDEDWQMFRHDMDAEIRRAARGWAIAFLALRAVASSTDTNQDAST